MFGLIIGGLDSEYKVHSGIFDAKSYNDFLAKIINTITIAMVKLDIRFLFIIHAKIQLSEQNTK